MNRYLSRLAPLALAFITALGSAACTAPTDASGSFDFSGADRAHVQANLGAVDAALLAQEAKNLERISSELQSVVAQVNHTVTSVSGSCQGSACAALKAAHQQYGDATTRQMQQLQEIRDAVNASGNPYSNADDDRSALGGQMGFLSDLKYDFGGIEAAASELQGAAARTSALLDEARGSIVRLAPVWGGTGSEAFQAMQARWDSGSSEHNASLQRLARIVSDIGQQMQDTDRGVAGMFD